MAGARNRLSPEEAVQCLARLRVRLAGQGACLPPPAAWHPVACPPTVCFGGPWLGRTTRPSGWWSSWPRSDRGLRGPRGNDAGGHPQSDPWPPNTGPPLGPPPQQGDAKHLCICVHGAHAAARPPRGHASPHSAHAERAWALEDVRPGFESHPNPHDPVRTRSASEPGTSAPGRTARPPGPSGPRTAESQPPWGALRDLCYHEAGPLTVPAVQMRKQAQRADRQVRKPARPHRRPGLRLLLPSALPNGNGALGPEGPRRERALAAVLAAISGVTATALRLARRGWAASSGLTFDSSPDQGHIHGTDGKFSPDAKTRIKRLQDQNRKG